MQGLDQIANLCDATGTRSSTLMLCGGALYRETRSLAVVMNQLAVAGAQLSRVGVDLDRVARLGHEPQVAGPAQAALEAQEAVLAPLHTSMAFSCWGVRAGIEV